MITQCNYYKDFKPVNAPFLYLLKASEKQGPFLILGGENIEHWLEMS